MPLRYIYFISDLHLSKPPEESTEAWDFFETRRGEDSCEEIVILGDLFAGWWGDDHRCRAYTEWEQYFGTYPIRLSLLLGNRDFLCGTRFFERTRIRQRYSGEILHYGGQKIALFHGDEPGLQDWSYQIFRKIARNYLRSRFLSLPESLRRWVCGQVRKHDRIMTVPEKEFVIDFARWLNLCSESPSAIVHGHLHIPIAETAIIHNHPVQRYQLGSWDQGASSYLQLSSSGQWVFFCDPINLELATALRGKASAQQLTLI